MSSLAVSTTVDQQIVLHQFTPRHSVQARAMLGWSREDLLQASGISMSALLRMEGALADSRGSTLNKVAKALTLAGIEFVTRDDGAIGVILKAQNPPDAPQ